MATVASQIIKQADVCGGDAVLRNTRATVWGLVEWRRLGLSDEEILKRTPGISRADLDAAWEYYVANDREIEDAIRRNQETSICTAPSGNGLAI